MPVSDLRIVTRAIGRLIREHVRVSPIWPNPPPVVSPRPPDQADGDGLTLFLYHIGRDPAMLSIVPPSPETAPHFAPLPLILNYQLAAHPPSNDIAGAETAQLLLTAAMLALNEHPVMTPNTAAGGVDIFSAVGISDPDVVLRLSMQPVGQAEALGYWTPGDTAARLAVYYQVTVQIAPAPVSRIGPRVLSYAVNVFAEGAPTLFISETRTAISRPGQPPEEVALRPAETPYGGRVTFIGGGLTGDRVELVLESDAWSSPAIVGADWAVQVGNGEISAIVQESADGQAVLPGLYRAKAQVIRVRTDAAGQSRDFAFVSNPIPFTVTPSTTNLTGPDINGRYAVTGRGFAHAEFTAADTALTILGQPLTLAGGADPGVGEYVVDSATIFRFQPTAELPRGVALPLRFIVRGASAPPLWVTLT